jgi:hypothetical protein
MSRLFHELAPRLPEVRNSRRPRERDRSQDLLGDLGGSLVTASAIPAR